MENGQTGSNWHKCSSNSDNQSGQLWWVENHLRMNMLNLEADDLRQQKYNHIAAAVDMGSPDL